MNETQAKILLASAAKDAGFNVSSPELRPSAFLAQYAPQGWDARWAELVEEARQSLDVRMWEGGDLPNGRSAPAEAVPGRAYWISAPNGIAIFQYVDSPYAPETPGLAPGSASPENVRVAMEAHALDIARSLAQQRMVQDYLEWLAEALL